MAVTTLTRERADLLGAAAAAPRVPAPHRAGPDRRAGGPAVCALDPARLVGHVAATEAARVRFAEAGAEAMNRDRGPDVHTRHRHLQAGEPLAGLLDDYEAVATVPDLDAGHADILREPIDGQETMG